MAKKQSSYTKISDALLTLRELILVLSEVMPASSITNSEAKKTVHRLTKENNLTQQLTATIFTAEFLKQLAEIGNHVDAVFFKEMVASVLEIHGKLLGNSGTKR